MKPNIKLSIFKLVPIALLALLKNVIAKLTGNAKLPTPPVTLANMNLAGVELETNIEDARFGSRKAREARNASVKKVRSILTQAGNYVRTTANGDAEILASSGFDMAKVPVPIGLPASPERLVVLAGPLSGQTESKWRRVRGATGYKVERSDKDPSVSPNWVEVATTAKARFIDMGLTSFAPYWYRVSAIGFAGEGKPCAPLMGRAA